MFIEIFYLVPFALVPVVTSEFNISLLEASLLITVPSFLALLMTIPAGFLADRFKVNYLLGFSVSMQAIAMLLISQTNSYLALLFFTSLMRITLPFYHTAGLGCLAKTTDKEKMSKLAGFHNAFGNVGQAVGVITLGICLLTIGWRWAYLIWSIPALIWSYVVWASLKIDKEPPKRYEAEDNGKLGRLSVVFPSLFLFLFVLAIREAGSTGAMTFMTTYFVDVRHLSQATATLVLGLGPFIGIFGSLLGGHLGERFGPTKALSHIILVCAASLFVLSIADQFYFLVIVYVVYSLFNSSAWAPINVIVANTSPSGSKGLGYSLSSLTEGIVASLAPVLIAGVIQLSNSLWIVFPLSVIFMLVSIIVLQVFHRK